MTVTAIYATHGIELLAGRRAVGLDAADVALAELADTTWGCAPDPSPSGEMALAPPGCSARSTRFTAASSIGS